MMQSVSLDKVTMIDSDEVEMVGRAKIHHLLTYLYVELCQRMIFRNFHCEGCELTQVNAIINAVSKVNTRYLIVIMMTLKMT